MRRLLLSLACCGLLLASASLPVAADPWYSSSPVLGIIDAGRDASAARTAGASWDRALFLWQLVQPNGPNDWQLDSYVDQARLAPSLVSGLPVVGVVQGTPAWADTDWHDGAAGVPTGLEYSVDDPRNTFGQFMLRLARAYRGRITTWVVWNEPDFLPGESGTWWTWSGTAADFYKLLKTAYRAIKEVDPSATVVFPATTYFADAVHGRELFLSRVLQEANKDSEAPSSGYFFDAVAVNLYCSLDALYRVHGVYTSILAQYQLQKPIWLTETNCPVYNDATAPEPATGRITTSEQAAYLIQAIALARAAGYQRIGWYTMLDHDASSGIVDRWGLLRANATPRPAYQAFHVASAYLSRSDVSVRLAPFGTATANGWPVTRIVIDDPLQHTRVQVMWRTADGPSVVNVQASGTAAELIDPLGFTQSAARSDAGWSVQLPPPRLPQPSDPPGFQSAGNPVLLVESGVAGGQWTADAPGVTSPLVALTPSILEPAPSAPLVARPGAVAPSSAASLPAVVQPGPSLVLTIGNPQPGDLLPRSKYVMQGLAFDRAAASGSGVDRVSVFLDDRDAGGQHLSDATLGQPTPTGFSATIDLSRLSGSHTLFVYARSAVSGNESVVSFPVSVGSH
jgi:polysaccharide biosynthesis protein PslG